MPLRNSYVIWNNKGGVGKTTLTFHMATHYAISHPWQKVLVIDLCPQANVSMALLRSSDTGILKNLVSERKTISFYVQQVASIPSPAVLDPPFLTKVNGFNYVQQAASIPSPAVDPRYFLTNINCFNNQIPGNVELLCGDMHLELVSRSLEQKRQWEPSAWVSITSCVRYFIEGNRDPSRGNVMEGVAEDPQYEWIVFIDTNPSFSVYTEIALVAAQRLIIPINADDFSREALKALFHLVYGYGIDEFDVPFEFKDLKLQTFSYKAGTCNVRQPQIHLVIHNRATRYNFRSAAAFQLMAQSTVDVVRLACTERRECFVPKFAFDTHFHDIYDFHTVGIVALHTGCPLAKFTTLNVPVFNGTVSLNRTQIDLSLQCLQSLVNRL